MFSGNKRLRGKDQSVDFTKELYEEYIRCQEDVAYFASKYFYITTIDYGKIVIPLWEFQKKVLKACVKPPNGKRHIIICSSRQVSKTTMTSIYALHEILFKKDYTIAILANKEKTAMEILDRIKMAYENLPMWLQQGVVEWSKGTITLENGCRIIASSTSSSGIRGYTINCLILDEFSFVHPNMQKDFMSSVLPTTSSGITSKIIIISTPNGIDMYYNIWMSAVRGENSYYPIKIMWNDVPGRDEAWKQRMIQDLPDGLNQFNVEFGCRFLGSANTLIDPDKLDKFKFKPYIAVKWNGLMKIWEEPIMGKKYVIGVDTAAGGGTKASNYSVVNVLKINSVHDVEQIAVYRCKTISPYDYANVVVDVSTYYNNAPAMIENNADVGGILISTLWHDHEFDRIINIDDKYLGIRASILTKREGNILMKRYLENDWLRLNDKDTIHELSLYREMSLNCYSAGSSECDDCVTSLLWALFYMKTNDFLYSDIYSGVANPSILEKNFESMCIFD